MRTRLIPLFINSVKYQENRRKMTLKVHHQPNNWLRLWVLNIKVTLNYDYRFSALKLITITLRSRRLPEQNSGMYKIIFIFLKIFGLKYLALKIYGFICKEAKKQDFTSFHEWCLNIVQSFNSLHKSLKFIFISLLFSVKNKIVNVKKMFVYE